jgi:cytochrome c553
VDSIGTAGRSLRLAQIVTVVLAAMFLGPAAATPAIDRDSMAQRMLPCAACHGEEGRATSDGYYPRIAGKPAGYLFRQLLNFREGRRLNAQMSYLLERQSDAYLQEMAQYFAGLSLPYPPATPPVVTAATLEHGRRLVRQGDPERGIPSCQACHGERLTGVSPDVPGLLGLPYDYLMSQFGAWRQGNRRAVAPDCMAEITHRLQPKDIAAASAWLATQAMPSDTRAADRFEQPLPIACGSVGDVAGDQR